MKLLRRICPHWFGWQYAWSRRRRWCNVCGQQQHYVISSMLIDGITRLSYEGWLEPPES